MKKINSICAMVILMVSVIAVGSASAGELSGAITAEQAFDAVIDQKDPVSGKDAPVILVDVRTPEEYYWVGTAAKVDKIVTKTEIEIEPDRGEVKLLLGGRLLQFTVSGHPMFLPVRKVDEIEMAAIATNIPYKFHDYDAEGCPGDFNDNFEAEIEALATPDGEVVIILMCRSGKRTTDCVAGLTTSLFKAVYEIDRSDKNGRGGFQGTSYGNDYNGYRGFPKRPTSFQDYKSVSWNDAGLPIKIGVCPAPSVE